MKVLLVEDDKNAATYLVKGLSGSGYQVAHAIDGDEGLHLALNHLYDVLIIDRMLPHRDGLSIIRTLRENGVNTPVLVLSALGEVDDKVEGLCAGGDDYLSKPYSFAELLARLKAIMRRGVRDSSHTESKTSTKLSVANLTLDLVTRKVYRSQELIRLQPKELQLLEFLMRYADQVVTRKMLLEKVWGFHFDPETNVIDTQISRLRSKIDKGFEPPLLHTIRGKGYQLSDPNSDQK